MWFERRNSDQAPTDCSPHEVAGPAKTTPGLSAVDDVGTVTDHETRPSPTPPGTATTERWMRMLFRSRSTSSHRRAHISPRAPSGPSDDGDHLDVLGPRLGDGNLVDCLCYGSRQASEQWRSWRLAHTVANGMSLAGDGKLLTANPNDLTNSDLGDVGCDGIVPKSVRSGGRSP